MKHYKINGWNFLHFASLVMKWGANIPVHCTVSFVIVMTYIKMLKKKNTEDIHESYKTNAVESMYPNVEESYWLHIHSLIQKALIPHYVSCNLLLSKYKKASSKTISAC